METNTTLLTPLDFLEHIFPGHGKEKICRVLSVNHYDLCKTMDDLTDKDDTYEYTYDENGNLVDFEPIAESSSMAGDAISSNSNNNNNNNTVICKYYLNGVCSNPNCQYLHVSPSGKQPSVAPICKYFLNEGCFIANCPYRHSAETVLCKYWMMGTCNKGDNCIYSHHIEKSLEVINEKSKQPPQVKPAQSPLGRESANLDSNKMFPSLGGNSRNVKPTGPSAVVSPVAQQIQQTQQPRPVKEVELFPSLSDSKGMKKKRNQYQTQSSKVSSMNVQNGTEMSYIVQLRHLEEEFRHVPATEVSREFKLSNHNIKETTEILTKKYGPPRAPVPTTSSPTVTSTSRSTTPQAKTNIGWVGTGSELNHLYRKNRDEAILHARERNLCFNLAARAFLNNDPASAKRLSEKGHEHDRKMKELHAKAMELIFQERNMNFDSDTLDLHGLHVKEAIQILQERLAHNSEPLYVIIGVGHHSSTNYARLPTKVKEFVLSQGLKYKDCSQDKREGLIMIFK